MLGMSLDVELEVGRQDEESVARLLRALPDWFGIDSATQSYIDDARTFPTVLARWTEQWSARCSGSGTTPSPPRCT